MKKLSAALILVAAQALSASVQAISPAGRVLFVAGPNEVTGFVEDRVLSKGDPVYEGDMITTGPRARIQLLMMDNARIAIRENTIFRFETYSRAKSSATIATASDAEGKVSILLAKGAFRSITGTIGKSYREDAYQIHTPVRPWEFAAQTTVPAIVLGTAAAKRQENP